MRQITRIILTACVIGVAFTATAEDKPVTVDTMPPSVIKTEPVCGDTEVSADTKEIKVTFSKDMQTRQMWAWCMYSPETFPEVTDQKGIKFLDDKRTCVLPVKLEPGKTYVIWINTQKQNAFRDTSGNAAVPYLLVFKTK